MTDDIAPEERAMMIHAMPTLTENTAAEKPGYSYTTFEAYLRPSLQVPATTVLGDGQSESTNQIVETAIRYGFSVDLDAHWPQQLPRYLPT